MRRDQKVCPCCGRMIFGTEENQYTRTAVKTGTKLVVKEGAKFMLDGGATSAGAEIGGTLGSIFLPGVGTALGAALGGMASHIAADYILDEAYDAAEEEFCPKTYYFYCPDCDLEWTSNDHGVRNVLLKNYREKFNVLSKVDPEPPTKEVEIEDTLWTTTAVALGLPLIPLALLFMLHVCAFCVYLMTFTLWDPTDITWGWITEFSFKAFIFALVAFGVVGLYYVIKKLRLHLAYERKMKEYNDVCRSNEEFNEKLRADLLKELNSILVAKSMKPERRL